MNIESVLSVEENRLEVRAEGEDLLSRKMNRRTSDYFLRNTVALDARHEFMWTQMNIRWSDGGEVR